MNEKQKRSLGILIVLAIVIAAIVKNPEIFKGVMYLAGIMIIGKVFLVLLNAKDKKDAESNSEKSYEKIPTGVMFVIAGIFAIVGIKVIASTFIPFILLMGIIWAIFVGSRITKNINDDLKSDNIVDFKNSKKRK